MNTSSRCLFRQDRLCLQVPPDFDPGCIAEVDDSTAEKLTHTLAIAVMERADALCRQVCPLPLPLSLPPALRPFFTQY